MDKALNNLKASPLDRVWKTGLSGPAGETALHVERTTAQFIVQLSLFPGNESKALTKLKKLGVSALPENGMSLSFEQITISFLGAGRYLLESDSQDLNALLGKAIPASTGSITDLSSARTVLTLTGPAVEMILSKGAAMDFSLAEFPVGKVAQTSAHHMPITIVRSANEQFRALVFSTYAESTFHWIELGTRHTRVEWG